MPRKRSRITDHDYSTNLYIAQIEAAYNLDIDVALDAAGRGSEANELQCSIVGQYSWPDKAGRPVLLARGPVSTVTNARFNNNVRYLLTVAMLSLIEREFSQKDSPPSFAPSGV